MNNEPVAWMYERPNGSAKLTFVREPMAGTVVTETPLYTHPVKELTNDEIKDLIQEYWGDVHIVDPDGYLHEVAFIKAILRKAQEK